VTKFDQAKRVLFCVGKVSNLAVLDLALFAQTKALFYCPSFIIPSRSLRAISP